jgi:UDP-N-acetylmuramoyl-L-alanyl-D-glutamate--2,6-diaminopimelate ligase
LAAVAAGVALDQPPETIVAGLGRSTGAPGRLERVGSNDDFLVLVDYAHTPGALDSVLSAVRRLDHRRLITVFGCGGDRDRTKRPLMARAAGQWSDLTILTSDNPRTEDPLAIIDQAAEGFAGLDRRKKSADQLNGTVPDKAWTVEPDRRAAIGLGCRLMEPGDVLVIAGKGHEDYQVLGRTKVHFDDREEAAAALLKEGKF